MISVRTPSRLGSVPNKPRTQHRSIRIADEDWADLDAIAQMFGTNRAQVINDFVRYFLRRPGAKSPKRPSPEQVAQVVNRRKAGEY